MRVLPGLCSSFAAASGGTIQTGGAREVNLVVVPAKAGTHNHRWLLFRASHPRVADTFRITEDGGYGSPPSRRRQRLLLCGRSFKNATSRACGIRKYEKE